MSAFKPGKIVRKVNRAGYFKVIGIGPAGKIKLESYHAPGIKSEEWEANLIGTDY